MGPIPFGNFAPKMKILSSRCISNVAWLVVVVVVVVVVG